MGWPEQIRDLIVQTFGNDTQRAYGQLSTVDSQNQPSVRTVHIHCIEHPTQGLVVSCNIQSEKWSHLKKNPKVAGCFWDMQNQVQIRFEGNADLITKKDKDFSDFVQTMWLKMRKEVRVAYLLDEIGKPMNIPNPNVEPTQHSKNHGILLITPTLWDVFYNDPKDYRLGKRSIYQEKNGKWTESKVNSLHEKASSSKP